MCCWASALLLLVTALTNAVYGASAVRYVKPGGMTSSDCTSWESACTLWYALSTVITGSGDEIWVASGTYTPTIGVTRTATFQLKSGVALYGGFTGTETRRDQRNWTANVTILSGDIGVPGVFSDNAYHVLRSIGVDNSAVVDGFTVRDGNANGDITVYQDIGGGLCNCGDGPYPNNVPGGSPTVRNMIFYNNSAAYSGAAMFNWVNSSPIVSNVTFISNSVGAYGGAMDNYNGSSPSLSNVTFMSNTGTYGGALSARLYSSPTLTNVLFVHNHAYRGGAIHNEENSFPLLTHVTIVSNSASDKGGAISNWETSPPLDSGHVIVRNSIFWGNSAGTDPEINNDPTSTIAVVAYTDIQGGYTGTGNLNLDPQFVNAGANNYHLSGTSPAINAGLNLGVSTDLDGNPRDSQPDMGAYERVSSSSYQNYLPLTLKNH